MIKQNKMWLFYISALIAIVGAIGYQFLVKQLPASINPLISNLGIYAGVIVLCIVLLPFFPPEGGVMAQIRQLSWLHIGLAFSVLFIEIGFLLMYRAGWNLSTGNIMTGVVINLSLVNIGLLAFNEKLNTINFVGVILCIIGVTLINYR